MTTGLSIEHLRVLVIGEDRCFESEFYLVSEQEFSGAMFMHDHKLLWLVSYMKLIRSN